MTTIKLTYFNGKGSAEAARLAFRCGGIQFEDIRLNREQWMELKTSGGTPFGQLPTLEVDGRLFSQSHAILRYAGKLSGLYPTDGLNALKVDMILDSQKDIMNKLTPSFYEKDEEKKRELRESLKRDVYPDFLNRWSEYLRDSDGNWITGTEFTIADVSLFTMFDQLSNLDYIGFEVLNSYPSLLSFYERAKQKLA